MAEKWQVAVYGIHNTSKDTKEVYSVLDNDTKTHLQKQRKPLSKLLVVEGTHNIKGSVTTLKIPLKHNNNTSFY